MKYMYNNQFGTITYNENQQEKTIYLSPLQNTMFDAFTYNNKQTRQMLAQKLYEISDLNVVKDCIRHQVSELNKKIEPIGKIENIRGFGYILKEKEGGKE